MKKIVNQVLCLVAIFVINSTYYSQTKTKYTFYNKILAIDSLAGFDENFYINLLTNDGFYGKELNDKISLSKRSFIDSKYNLNNKNQSSKFDFTESFFSLQALPNFRNIGNPSVINAVPFCNNEGFESSAVSVPTTSTIVGWDLFKGTNLNVGPTGTNTGAYMSTVAITSPLYGGVCYSCNINIYQAPLVDPLLTAPNNTIPASPFAVGGITKVLKLNDGILPAITPGGGAGIYSRASTTFSVGANNTLFKFAYLSVMSANINHVCTGGQQQASFKIGLINNIGGELSCPSLFFASPTPNSANSVCSSINAPAVWSPPIAAPTAIRYNSGTGTSSATPTWQQGFIDLTPYIGQNMTVFLVSTDCAAGGHYGYTYVDTECGQLGVIVTTPSYSTFVSSPTASVNLVAQCATTATMTITVNPNVTPTFTQVGPICSGATLAALPTTSARWRAPCTACAVLANSAS
jgi:hypothetical protein